MGPDKKKLEALEMRMKKLGVTKDDFEEKFIKSSGRGGQKVNKTSSAVFIRHKETQLSVKCGKSRSQHLNRFLAMRTLVDMIEARRSGRRSPSETKQERIRKQKLRRKRKTRKRLSPDE